MSPFTPVTARSHGVITLSVTVVLLVAASLVVFYANRSLLFEQRASANQLRSARALAAAESGLEWTLARLNDPRKIDEHCNASTSGSQSFRERYAPSSAVGFAPAISARPSCRLGEVALVCSCPLAGHAPALAGDDASFSVELSPLAGDGEALRVISRGCTTAASDCIPGSAAGPAEATIVLQSIVKLVPPLTGMPVASVTSGGTVDLVLGARLTNTEASTQGLLVDAAGAVTGGALGQPESSLRTVPGSPWQNAILAGDGTLAAASATDSNAAFLRRFGLTVDEFRADPAVRVVQGCAGAACAQQIAAASADGVSALYVEGDLVLGARPDASTLGSESRPALVVVTGRFGASPGTPWFGLVHFAGDASIDGIDLRGALVSQGNVRIGGDARVSYSPTVIQGLRTRLGRFARLPGSWRDGQCASDDPAQPCSFAP